MSTYILIIQQVSLTPAVELDAYNYGGAPTAIPAHTVQEVTTAFLSNYWSGDDSECGWTQNSIGYSDWVYVGSGTAETPAHKILSNCQKRAYMIALWDKHEVKITDWYLSDGDWASFDFTLDIKG